jgi:hypothetical protein
MSVESATTIGGLNPLLPAGADTVHEGDDHIRLLKSVVKLDALSKAETAVQTIVSPLTVNAITGIFAVKGNANAQVQMAQKNAATNPLVAGIRHLHTDTQYLMQFMLGDLSTTSGLGTPFRIALNNTGATSFAWTLGNAQAAVIDYTTANDLPTAASVVTRVRGDLRYAQGGSVPYYATRALAAAATHDAAVSRIEIYGDAAIGDGKGGSFIRTDTLGNLDTLTDAGGVTWYRAPKGFFRWWSKLDLRSGNGRYFRGAIILGDQAGGNVTPDDMTGGVLAIGHGALRNAVAGNSIAIGDCAMEYSPGAEHSLAIGASALAHVVAEGHRNIAIGSLAGHFITTGYRNLLIGRDSGHSLVGGYDNVGIGYRALSTGKAIFGFDGGIGNQYVSNAFYNVAVGVNALHDHVGDSAVAIGYAAGRYAKGNGHVLVGRQAGFNLDYDLSENAKVVTYPGTAATYTQAGKVLTFTATASGVVAGNKVGITFLTGNNLVGKDAVFWTNVASVLNVNQFTIMSTETLTDSGTATISIVETATARAFASANTIVGAFACDGTIKLNNSTVVGWGAARSAEGSFNALLGQSNGEALTTGSHNTGLGSEALKFCTTGGYNTGIGRNALNLTVAGSNVTIQANCTGVGANTRISGDNQVQLGDSATTTYAYGAVQNRSDARDKADITGTALGLDFIVALRPVDFRWDMRDDYIEASPEGEPVIHPRDGSKKRARLHHGFIAQEIMAVTDQFGGVQDHKVNGGDDVLTLGYSELIAPLVKAVQELSARIAALEAA